MNNEWLHHIWEVSTKSNRSERKKGSGQRAFFKDFLFNHHILALAGKCGNDTAQFPVCAEPGACACNRVAFGKVEDRSGS